MNKVEEIKEDLSKIQEIVILANSKGGKQLIAGLSEDLLSSIDKLINERETLTLQGFISLACDIKTKLDVVRLLKKSKKNETFLKELLDEALA